MSFFSSLLMLSGIREILIASTLFDLPGALLEVVRIFISIANQWAMLMSLLPRAVSIRAMLKAKGLTQKDFARLLNKRDSEISKWLTGRHNFTTQTISLMRSAIPKDKSNSAFCSAGIAARQSRNNSFCIITLKFQMRL